MSHHVGGILPPFSSLIKRATWRMALKKWTIVIRSGRVPLFAKSQHTQTVWHYRKFTKRTLTVHFRILWIFYFFFFLFNNSRGSLVEDVDKLLDGPISQTNVIQFVSQSTLLFFILNAREKVEELWQIATEWGKETDRFFLSARSGTSFVTLRGHSTASVGSVAARNK